MAYVTGDRETVVRTWQPWVQVLGIGAGLGLVHWILTILIGNYVVEPMVCRQLTNAAICTNAGALAGNIATVFVALIGTGILVRMQIPRPIILAVATGALLWDLAAWTSGLIWIEAIIWSIWLYAMSYVMFAWIARYSRLWAVVALSLLIVLIIRIALVL